MVAGSVMVWGCITSKGVGCLRHINGIMDSAMYVKILKKEYLGTLKDHGYKVKDVYFQQDGNPKHHSNFTLEWIMKRQIDVFPCQAGHHLAPK